MSRTMYWVIGGVVLVLAVVGLFTFNAQKDDEAAQANAAELTQKFEQAGLPVPVDQDIIVRTLGYDGGAVCDDPGHALRKALLFDQLTNGASFVGRRPIIADRRAVLGQVLIMQTYCPDELAEFRETFDDLKFDDVVEF